MATYFKALYQYRELLLVWTIRNIKVRYKQSILGAGWAILQPLSLMVAFSLIFTYIVRIPTDGVPYPIFSYAGLLPWIFFATSISYSVISLVQNMNLVTKIYFPREILPISTVAASLVDFLVASIIFIGMMFYYRIPLSATMLLVPIILTVQVLLILGIVFFVSALNVFYRDFRFLVPLGVQLWMYATPVIYPVTLVPERFQIFYMLNPMAGLIESYRSVTIHGILPNMWYLGLSAVISLVIFLSGYLYFKKVEWMFSDLI